MYNPALLLDGSWQAILYVILTALSAGFLVAEATVAWGRGGKVNHGLGLLYFLATIIVGSATIWLGAEQPLSLAVAAAGAGIVWYARRSARLIEHPSPAE